MTVRTLLTLLLFQIAPANADTGKDFWKNCPGPACPAHEDAPPKSAPAHEHARPAPAPSERPSGAPDDLERMDTEELHKQRERHELEINKIEKEERKRDRAR